MAILLLACGGASQTTEVLAPATPSLTSQPLDQTATLGQTATFSVTATGLNPFTYQWSKDGAPIPAATSTQYVTAATTKADDGALYSVVLTNRLGSVTSHPATLKVQWAPILTAQPGDQTVTEGQLASFTVAADANPASSYQWQKNLVDIPGANTASYQVDVTTLADSGNTYRCQVSNAVGSSYSNAATLTVNPAVQPPVISGFTATPSTLTLGQSTTLAWMVAGASSLSIDQGVGSVMGLSNLQVTPATSGAFTYTLTASNAAGSTQATAQVIVGSVPIHALTVNLAPGTTGLPAATTSYPQGTSVNYSYALQTGYQNLQVTLDGSPVAVSGSVIMNGPHLLATTAQIQTFTITASAGSNGTITPPGITTLNYGGSQTYSITPDAGYQVANVLVDGVSIGAVGTHSFTNVTANHTLSATFSAIPGHLLTVSLGAGITGLPAATATYAPGTVVNYSYALQTGYQNLQVTLDGAPVAATGTVTMAAAHALVATAQLQTYTIAANPGPNGIISPAGVTTVPHGGSQLYNITPDPGYRVFDVVVDGVSIGAPAAYTFSNVVASHTLSATFQILTFPITATPGPNGTITPTGTTSVNYGGSQTYTIAGNAGYQVAGVIVDGSPVGALSSYTFTNVTATHTIGATFSPIPTYALTIVMGGGVTGTPSLTATHPQGTVVNYSYSLQPGYQNLLVTLDGNPMAASGTVTMNGPHTLAISALIQTFNLSASAGANGTISPIGVTTLNWGSSQTFTITPNSGYVIANVLVDGVSVGAVSTYTFTALAANHTIAATFSPIPDYILTVNRGPGITGEPSTSLSYTLGTSVHYAYALTVGYQNLQVTLDGNPAPIFGDVLMDGPHTLNATAQIQTFTITASPGPNGTISPAGATSVNFGGSQAYTITPNAGYQVANVIVDGASLGALTAYTVTNVTSNIIISATFTSLPLAELALPLAVHPGDTWMQASVPVQSGMTYAWSKVDGTSIGTITSGQTTGVIAFTAGAAGTFQLQSDVQKNPFPVHATATRTVTVQTGTWLVKNGSLSAARNGRASALLPSGRVLLVGGSWLTNTPESAAEIYDPATSAWSPTGSLGTPRYGLSATPLPTGKVLVSGGHDASGYLTSAELYDPAAGTWTGTGALNAARSGHTATQLANGKVLVVGGSDGTPSTLLATADLYDSGTGTWTPTGSLATGRSGHTATLLANGKVLVAGGRDGLGANASPELYDPALGTWAAAGSLSTGRTGHTATLLPNGQVVVTGGLNVSDVPLASSELYDPTANTWTASGGLGTARSGHSATLLANGKVLIAGGSGISGALATSEVFTSGTGTWASTTGSLATARTGHAAALLQDGTVLVAGGSATDPLGSSELFNATAGTWSSPGSLGTARADHSATLLVNGQTLVVGGLQGTTALATALLYDATARTWTSTTNLGTARYGHTATRLGDGKVLVTGGRTTASGYTGTAELYDPGTGLWAATGSLLTPRAKHSATLLEDGKVLVAGGTDGSSQFASAEIYDPGTGLWSATGTLNTARAAHSATLLLPSGQVLVVGGFDGSGALQGAELFDPTGGTWTPTAGSLGTARSAHSATQLLDGTVLVVGGIGTAGTLQSAEAFDLSGGGTWTPKGSLSTARSGHSVTLLADGTVLVVGGGNGTSSVQLTAELYTPGLGTWALTGSLNTARSSHTATLLNDGTVLVAFGVKGDVITEIYRP